MLPNLGGNREYDPKDLAGMAVPQWRDGLRALMSNYLGGIVSNVEKFWKCIRLPLSLALGQDHLEERRSKAAIWEGHIKACIAELYSSVIARTVTRIVID